MGLDVKFMAIHEDAVLPRYAKEGDAGLDLTCVDDGTMTDKYVEYRTGVAVEIPEGYVGLLFPRSSVSNHMLIQSNCVGVVDSGYRGEIKLRFKYVLASTYYEKGQRIGQLLILPYPKITPGWSVGLSETERGSGGFGSSGAV